MFYFAFLFIDANSSCDRFFALLLQTGVEDHIERIYVHRFG